MPDFLIQYRVFPDKVTEQEAAIREFVAGIKADADPEARYDVYKKEDGVSFVHHAWVANEDALKRLQAAPHFKAFSEGVRTRCEEGPTVTKLAHFATSEA